MTGNKPLYCSFCGKSQHKVRKLIAGPTAFICNECIDLCVDVIDDTDPSMSDATKRLKQIASISAQLDWLRLRLDALSDPPRWEAIMTPADTLTSSSRAGIPTTGLVIAVAELAPPSVTGIDWIAGLPVICDLDPRDGLSFPRLRSLSPLHGDVREEDAFPSQVSQKHDVVVVGDVVSFVQIPHSQNPQSKPFSQDQVCIGGFAGVQFAFANGAKS